MAISNAMGAGWSVCACDPVNRSGAPGGAAEQDAVPGARHEGVESALEGEGAHEGCALHPDGTGYAKLVLAL